MLKPCYAYRGLGHTSKTEPKIDSLLSVTLLPVLT
jgi:hypothetical protein